jgi:RNA polymerase sigma-70 factor (ECF subfamily)
MASSLALAPTLPRMADPDRNVTAERRPWGDASRVCDLESLGEDDLVSACVAGVDGAFDVLVRRQSRAVYRLCYRFTGNHEDASDLSQEIFLRAYKGLRSFRGGSSVRTWLYRIGINVCLSRASARQPVSEPIDARPHVDVHAESPPDRLLRGERAEMVRRAIVALPPKQRAALVLRVYHEMSHKEIAAVLGSTVGTVKANVFHALQNLKRWLGEERH